MAHSRTVTTLYDEAGRLTAGLLVNIVCIIVVIVVVRIVFVIVVVFVVVVFLFVLLVVLVLGVGADWCGLSPPSCSNI